MFSKSVYCFFVISMFMYGDPINAEVSNYEKLLEKISKLEVKVGILENEVQMKDKFMKFIIAEQIAGLETKKCKNSPEKSVVAFSAHTSTKSSYDKGDPLVFGSVVLNEGNGYNYANGRFTAPVSGLYQFMVHVCNYSGQHVATAIVHDHTDIANSIQYQPSGSSCSTVTALRFVEKDEDVFVKCTYPTKFEKGTHRRSTFSGVMLSRK